MITEVLKLFAAGYISGIGKLLLGVRKFVVVV